MTLSKRARGIMTPTQAAQRAARKVVDLTGVFTRREGGDGPPKDGPKIPTGRAANRQTKHGYGRERPWRSRMQRSRRKRRTGGVK